MNPVPISPSDLMLLLFGSHEKRHDHLDQANFHWLRRLGAPAMDMPSKIILPHIAGAITAADPDGVYTHVQIVSPSPDFTYHVLWLKHHWLESEERKRLGFYAAIDNRARIDELNAKCEAEKADADNLAERLDLIAARLAACTDMALKKSRGFIANAWRDACGVEEQFRNRILALENLFNYSPIYEPPQNTTQAEAAVNEIPAEQNREDGQS